jgi:Xaa-Pro aminopeptidase
MFDIGTYIERRNKLKMQMDSGLILILGNEESPINYTDNPYWFRQDSTFLYYFGLNKPGLIGMIDIDKGKEYLFGNKPTIDDIIWGGNKTPIEEQAQTIGIKNTGIIYDVERIVKNSVSKDRKVHLIPQYRAENKIKISNWLNCSPDEVPKFYSEKLIKTIVAQREIKSKEELNEIEKAVNTTVEMHKTAMQIVKPGLKELDIVSEIEKIVKKEGGNTSFPTIATKHGEIMHNHYHGNQLMDGDMFLLDCGAETTMGYAGDLSSTMPVGTSFTDRQKDIYNITLESHNTSIEMLKPGLPFKDIHFQACRIIVEGLKNLGIMKGNTDDALEVGAHALFFPCGLGHQMGLDVHDMENLGEEFVGYNGSAKSNQFGLKSLRMAKPLKTGMVLTIEPGIYFIPMLINIWKRENRFTDFINYAKLEDYLDFGGIRNEEDFVITDEGYALIGNQKPKTIEDVENQKS